MTLDQEAAQQDAWTRTLKSRDSHIFPKTVNRTVRIHKNWKGKHGEEKRGKDRIEWNK